MVITSVNREIEVGLLQDSGFLYSHLAHSLTPCFDSDVSGRALEASIAAKDIEVYESLVGADYVDVVTQAKDAVVFFLNNQQLLSTVDSLQTVLMCDEVTRPVSGLPALIMLEKIVRSETASIGNVVLVLEDFSQGSDYFELPTYLSFNGSGFYSSMVDAEEREHELEYNCLYLPLSVKSTNAVNTDFAFNPTQSDWVYRLIRNYTQGHYSLERACEAATKNIDVFCLLVAPILGASVKMVTPNIGHSSFDSLTPEQQYGIVATIKPLIEYISYDFSRNQLPVS